MVDQEEVDMVGGPAHDKDGDHHREHDHDLKVNMFNHHIARSSQPSSLQFALRSLKWQEYFAQSQVGSKADDVERPVFTVYSVRVQG